jgi:hypothetical protein
VCKRSHIHCNLSVGSLLFAELRLNWFDIVLLHFDEYLFFRQRFQVSELFRVILTEYRYVRLNSVFKVFVDLGAQLGHARAVQVAREIADAALVHRHI